MTKGQMEPIEQGCQCRVLGRTSRGQKLVAHTYGCLLARRSARVYYGNPAKREEAA